MANHKVHTMDINGETHGWGVRHLQAILLFFSLTVGYLIRTCMSVAVIAMTDTTTPPERAQIFNWNKQIQEYLLGSFFWGYLVVQIPAGYLAYKYGGKRFVAIALILNGIISFAIPTASKLGGWKAVVACRVLQGLSQGCLVPSIHTLLGKWAPVNERTRIGNFVYTGGNLGTIIGMPMTGLLAGSKFGWPMIFYITGVIGVLVGLVWIIFGADSPAEHPSITFEERSFIETSLSQTNLTKKPKVPYRAMITSMPVLALLVAHVGATWGFLMMLAETPSFLKLALGINVEKSGIIAAAPYIAGWIITLVTSFIVDYLHNRKIYNNTTIRKVCNTIGTWGPAAGLLVLTTIPAQHYTLAIFTIIAIVALDSVNLNGFLLNHIDLSPNYSGVLMSFSNSIAAAVSTLGPIYTGLILEDPTDIRQWRIVFFITASVYFFSNLIFIIFGSGDRQSWDHPNIQQKEPETEITNELLSKSTKYELD